tara:strand:- start:500 stop:676 length:177 start_codon:yes stop_codon:yes gene_type:complete
MHAILKLDTNTPMKTINLTEGQLEYLQELVMFAYEMDVPEQKGWDVQTYDNLVDEVMK